MSTQAAGSEAQLQAMQQKMTVERRFFNGVNWFFWIAALSLINTVIAMFGLTWVFIFGLGATQLVDGVVAALVESYSSEATLFRVVGFGLNLGIAGLFVIFGLLGRARRRAAIITGMVLYVLDALLVLVFQDYVGAAFHAWALFGIFTGLRALGQLQALEKPAGSEVIQTLD